MHQPTPQLRSSKRPTFADAFDPKRNAFGFLRLTLAILVIFSHSFPLGGFGIDALERFTRGRHTIGLVAVAMFFVLSGFLISRSADRSVSVGRFVWHRFLRIFPGYWVCLIVSGFVFAPLIAAVEHGTILRVFSAPQDSPQSYLLHNAGLFHLNGGFTILGVVNIWPQGIAGLLMRNPMPYVINGSLWTLPFEVGCYLGVGLLALFGLMRRARLLFLVSFLALWFFYAYSYLYRESFDRCFPCPGLKLFLSLAVFFSAGCLCFVYRNKIPYSRWIFVTCLAGLALSLPMRVFGLVTPVLMTYAFLWLAFSLPFSRFDAKGDYSYGTYIYAFPVQQGLALAGIQEEGFALYFGASLAITLLLAFLSYRLVEAPCLQWKNLDFARILRLRPKRSRVSVPIAPSTDSATASVNL